MSCSNNVTNRKRMQISKLEYLDAVDGLAKQLSDQNDLLCTFKANKSSSFLGKFKIVERSALGAHR